MKLFTNRYQSFKPSQGTPVRATYGQPKFYLRYPLHFQSKLITPGGWFMSGTDEEFTRRYYSMLDKHGVAAIRAELQTIVDLSGNDRLVLLCFDDVDRGLCHRTLFAKWWYSNTGEEVVELQNVNRDQDVLF